MGQQQHLMCLSLSSMWRCCISKIVDVNLWLPNLALFFYCCSFFY